MRTNATSTLLFVVMHMYMHHTDEPYIKRSSEIVMKQMRTLELTSVTFSVFNDKVTSNNNIPTIRDKDGMSSSELYAGDSSCAKCSCIDNNCRGHVGKILLNYKYVLYVYKSKVKMLLKLTCNICYRPLRTMPKTSHMHDIVLHRRLCDHYDSLCQCTGIMEKLTPSEEITKLCNIYTRFERLSKTNVLNDLFHLDPRDNVLIDYILVPSIKLLKQIHNGAVVIAAYDKLFDSLRRNTSHNEIIKKVDDIMHEIKVSLKDKPGMLRKLLITRKVDNTARAVIVGDPWIGLEDVGVPKVIAHCLSANIFVDRHNLIDCMKLVTQQVANSLSHDGHLHKIVNNDVTLSVSFYIRNNEAISVSVDYDCCVICGNNYMKYLRGTEHEVMSQLQKDQRVSIHKDGVQIAHIETERIVVAYVNALFKHPQIHVKKVPLQEGCYINAPVDRHNVIVHRNPVLSANSLHHHKLKIFATSEQPCLTLSERWSQRQYISTCNQTIAVVDDVGKANDLHNADVTLEYFVEVTKDTKKYRMVTSRNNTLYNKRNANVDNVRTGDNVSSHDRNTRIVRLTDAANCDTRCALSLNPLATSPYGADFDGDEMNVALSAWSDTGDVSLLSDVTKGVFGPIHDAKYGLYCLCTDDIGLSSLHSSYEDLVHNELRRNVNNICCAYVDPSKHIITKCICDMQGDNSDNDVGFCQIIIQCIQHKECRDDAIIRFAQCGMSNTEAKSILQDATMLHNLREDVVRDGLHGSTTHDEPHVIYALCIRYIMRVFRQYSRYSQLGSTNFSVQNYLGSLRLNDCRHSLRNHFDYNEFFVSYIGNNDNMQSIYADYAQLANEREMLSQFYSDIAMYLYCICDHCGLYYYSKDRHNSGRIVESGCRPKQATYNTIYNEIGFTTRTLPNGVGVDYIHNNFMCGVTEQEYLSLCYANRTQAVNKAENTAPEGDNMRLRCNYMSSAHKHEDRWYNGEDVIYEHIDSNTTCSLSERIQLNRNNTYKYSLDSTFDRVQYRKSNKVSSDIRLLKRNVLHSGQRKLLMAEIDFLTDVSNDGDIVVYAGAAPGSHISTLLALFPNISFHLYDNASFSSNLRNKVTGRFVDRVIVHNEYLSAQLCNERYANTLGNLLFISDIRTNTSSNNKLMCSEFANTNEHSTNCVVKSKPTNDDVTKDNSTNLALVNALQPKHCMLKFRLPYDDGSTCMLRGELRLQCWSGHESTETRLVSSYPYETTNYSHREYEERMFCHNIRRLKRVTDMRLNEYVTQFVESNNIIPYYDAYREAHIVDKYVAHKGTNIRYVYECIGQTLNMDATYYKQKTIESLEAE